MENKYEIVWMMDNQYAVYIRGAYEKGHQYIFSGTLVDVNAWISLREKGYEF